jgi:hypothetical protein
MVDKTIRQTKAISLSFEGLPKNLQIFSEIHFVFLDDAFTLVYSKDII